MKRRQYTFREFKRVLTDNGYALERCNGDHWIFKKGDSTISIPYKKEINKMMAARLLKENSLAE